MRIPLLPVCSLALLFSSCGGDTPATPGTGVPAGQAPAPAQKPAPQEPAKRVPVVRLDMADLKNKFGGEPKTPASDNTVTPEKIALGKALYHEKHLSKNGNLSCASCHDLGNFGQDGKPTSPGTDQKNGDRNTPTTLNAWRQFVQFWDGRATTIEDQAIMPVLNPVEHGVADEAELVKKIGEKPELVAAFDKAFPGQPVSAANFKNAIGAFERQLTTKSKLDALLDGDSKAMSALEKYGLHTFVEVGCTECHLTRLVGGDQFQKMGKFKPYASDDIGREKVTGKAEDKFVFKVPTLLNVGKTAPYFHDGKVGTLADAVKVMADLQLNKQLSQEQIDGIVAFLEALTGEVPAAAK